MAKFSISLQKTLTHECGYTNNPDDSGGETYKSISRNSHADLIGWTIIDIHKNKPNFLSILEKDTILQKDVEVFYWTNFWLPLKAYQIQNQTSANSIFDFAVNAGIKISVQLVQSNIGTKTDGVVGDQTLKKLYSLDFAYFQSAFTVAKISHYISIIQKRPTNKKYLYGWINWALEYHS